MVLARLSADSGRQVARPPALFEVVARPLPAQLPMAPQLALIQEQLRRQLEEVRQQMAAEVRHNQLMRARSYARRYVPTSEVEHLEASDTFRRLYGLTDANGEIKAVTRESLGSSPGKK